MKKRLTSRVLLTLGLALSFVMSAVTPAHASARDDQRPRAGVSLWGPRSVDFLSEVITHNSVPTVVMVFGFDWYQPEHTSQLEGVWQTLELDAEVDCAWVQNTSSIYGNSSAVYDPTLWDTNIPELAHPYEDTIFGEPCNDDGDTGRGSFGVGVLDAAQLVHGQHYYMRIGIHWDGDTRTSSSNVKLSVGTGTEYDLSAPAPFGEDCSWSSGEHATWNDPSWPEIDTRDEASWCSWQDWNHTVVRDDSGQLITGQNKQFWVDYLTNQGVTGWTGYGVAGSGWYNYCSAGYFDQGCYTDFSGPAGTATSFWQDVTVPSSKGPFTAEAAVRCRPNASDHCQLSIGYWANGTSEQRFATTTIPDNDQWHICRLDNDHGGTSLLNSNTTSVKWQLYNHTGTTMSVDYTFLGGKTNRDDPSNIPGPLSAPGVGTVGYGNICTQV